MVDIRISNGLLIPKEFKLSGFSSDGREAVGFMLNVTGLSHLRVFPTDKRKKMIMMARMIHSVQILYIGDELKSAPFKDTVHQVCMSHARNKFVKASNQGCEPAAERFSHILKELL